MKATRTLSGLTGKVLAATTVMLVGIGTAAAAGALPGTSHTVTAAGHSVSASASASAFASSPGTSGAGGTRVGVALPAVGHVSADGVNLPAITGSTTTRSAGAGANVSTGGLNAGAGVSTGSLGTGARGGGTIVGHAGSGVTGTISGITSALAGCLSDLTSTATGQPMMALNSVIPTVVACVKNVIASLPVPTAASSCVSSLLNSLGGLPFIGSGAGMIDLSGCMAINLTTCIQAALNSVGGLLGGQIGVDNIPSTVVACASSIVTGVENLVNGLLSQVAGTAGGITGVPTSVSVGASTPSARSARSGRR